MLGLAVSLALTLIHLTVGLRLPLYVGAMGRVLAAHEVIPQSEMLTWCKAAHLYRRPSVDEFLEQVEQTRQRGWGLDQDQLNQFFSSIAAPIIDSEGRIRFCITHTMFAGQHSDVELKALGDATLKAADQASRYLYGRTRSAKPLGNG